MIKLAWISCIAGIFVIGIWSFNLLGFKKGAAIAIKNVVMNGFFLISSMGLGIVIFNEPFTLSKIISIPFYLIAFILLNRETNHKPSS
jgi:multidrug transporter EmrE-like cation transporter